MRMHQHQLVILLREDQFQTILMSSFNLNILQFHVPELSRLQWQAYDIIVLFVLSIGNRNSVLILILSIASICTDKQINLL